jgi:hypothetical protein
VRRNAVLGDNEAMTGIQFVTDEKGRKVAVQIDLKKHRAIWEDFWEGLVSESRRKEKGIPYEQYRANRLKRTGSRA